uniref:Lon N-terminal domain-containing protein n=1 Tax=Pseudo-nitzschia australis TaxID=44445 RepID=A0A7S4AGZ5_9STRA|mmetsp:Transcript_19233/g.41808  ORF Transcript_19233/g.41808 Transcript_19233/m.41808 type:complete len:480 (+) Transcript_19233:176-1615(+)
MKKISLRQRSLVRTLYRKILRECERIPPNTSLIHLDQWIGGTHIKDQENLRTCLRSTFRRQNAVSSENKIVSVASNDENIDGNGFVGEVEGIQKAMEGLKYLLSLDARKVTKTQVETESPQNEQVKARDNLGQYPFSLPSASPINSNSLLESVQWLPNVSDMKDTRVESSQNHLPVFPLSGPLFPDDQGKRLPLVSQFSEVPVLGMEMSLQIFEPRYRQMYHDLLSSSDISRRFIVPFSHPYRPGQFAAFGWIYEITYVHDVADESNGKIQLVCNHVVSKPVKILEIVNPTDYDTKLTYLRARVDILDNNISEDDKNIVGEGKKVCSTDLRPLKEMLQQLKNEPQSLSSDNTYLQISLIDRLLIASREGSVWLVAQVWLSHLQMDVLRLQGKISTRIQLQATAEQKKLLDINGKEWQDFVTEKIVLLAQEPYKYHLRSMLIEFSTLIPTLLQQKSYRAQCQFMHQRIRERLTKERDSSG